MICNMGLLDRQVLAGEFFPAQLEDGPFGFFPAGEDGAETSWQNAGRRIVLRQGPGPQFALADKNVLADPILHLLLKRDGVSLEELQDLMERARRRRWGAKRVQLQ